MSKTTYSLRATLDVPLERDHVFAMFSNAENLEHITPPELSFRILTSRPIAMRPGLNIDYSLRLWFLRMRWRSRIAMWRPPDAFTDVQLVGPYASWEHTHFFRDTDGGTRIIDEVRYQLPFGIVGRMIHSLIRAQLRRIFAYRQRAVLRLLMGEGAGMESARWNVTFG